MRGRGSLAVAAFLLAAAPAASREVASTHSPAWCGTTATRMAEVTARHALFARRRARAIERLQRRGEVDAARALADFEPVVTAAGNVAVIRDDGLLVADRSPFDLASAALRFKRRGARVRATAAVPGLSPDLGERLALGDDDSIAVELPFSFSFYGERHTRVFVNSDGNLTFDAPDSASTPRSLQRVLSGPPRVAGFFADLDPSVVGGERGIFARSTPTSFQVTWNDVPEFGTGNSNTLQVTLFSGGGVRLAFGDLAAVQGIVGVAPGLGGVVELVDYTAELPVAATSAAVLERFTSSPEIDDQAVAQTFFHAFADVYDHLLVWLDFPASLDGAFAFELTVANDIQGIGVPRFDFSGSFGSAGKLGSYVQMGTLANYPDRPRETFLGTNSTLDILGQEAGHRWLAFVRFRDGGGAVSSELLGRDFAHWSFHHDTDASDAEGNDIADNGGGSFTTVGATSRYSPLDRYLMGLISPEAVPDFFFVRGPSLHDPQDAPEIGVTFTGTRVDVGVEDVVSVEGPRVPSSAEAPHAFRMAFVLLTSDGLEPAPGSVEKVNRIRRKWRSYFRKATGRHGSVATVLEPAP